jgi:hypothetical protein
MNKTAHTALTAVVVSLFAASASAYSILAEVNFSGTGGTAVPVSASPILATNSQFTVFNAAISTNGVKAFGVGGTLSTTNWYYDSTGTAARNTDLYTVSNYAGPTRLDMVLSNAVAGQTYTITAVQIDVRAAATTNIVWQFGYQRVVGAVTNNNIIGNVAIAAQTTNAPISTYTIDLSSEGLTATDSSTAWIVSQGLRCLFYQPTGATADDGFEVDAIRFMTGTSAKISLFLIH